MEALLLEHGLPALFALSFLAATLVPLGSEWLLAVLLTEGFPASAVVPVATTGNTLGALTTYAVGLWGGPFLVRHILRINEEKEQRAESAFDRYGSWVLLLSWVPIIGDPLCLVGGVLKTSLWKFLALVAIGKLLRYLVVAETVLHGLSTVSH